MGLRENQAPERGEGWLSGQDHLMPGRLCALVRTSADQLHLRSGTMEAVPRCAELPSCEPTCRYGAENRVVTIVFCQSFARTRRHAREGRYLRDVADGPPGWPRPNPPRLDANRMRFDDQLVDAQAFAFFRAMEVGPGH